MSDKRCPYCGAPMDGNNCTGCGAIVPPEKQVEGDGAPPNMPPIIEPTGLRDQPGARVPWERRSEIGFFQALLDTARMVITSPGEFFSRMSRSGGFGEPLIYALIVGVAGVVVSQIWGLVVNSLAFTPLSMLGGMGQEAGEAMGGMAMGFAGFIISIVLSPIGVAVGVFFWAGIYHLMLIILGGANEEFETTFRVVSFSMTSNIAQVIPVLGGLISGIWGLVLIVIGLREAQDIDNTKAILVVLLPMIICCLFAGLLFAIFGAAILSGIRGGLGG